MVMKKRFKFDSCQTSCVTHSKEDNVSGLAIMNFFKKAPTVKGKHKYSKNQFKIESVKTRI